MKRWNILDITKEVYEKKAEREREKDEQQFRFGGAKEATTPTTTEEELRKAEKAYQELREQIEEEQKSTTKVTKRHRTKEGRENDNKQNPWHWPKALGPSATIDLASGTPPKKPTNAKRTNRRGGATGEIEISLSPTIRFEMHPQWRGYDRTTIIQVQCDKRTLRQVVRETWALHCTDFKAFTREQHAREPMRIYHNPESTLFELDTPQKIIYIIPDYEITTSDTATYTILPPIGRAMGQDNAILNVPKDVDATLDQIATDTWSETPGVPLHVQAYDPVTNTRLPTHVPIHLIDVASRIMAFTTIVLTNATFDCHALQWSLYTRCPRQQTTSLRLVETDIFSRFPMDDEITVENCTHLEDAPSRRRYRTERVTRQEIATIAQIVETRWPSMKPPTEQHTLVAFATIHGTRIPMDTQISTLRGVGPEVIKVYWEKQVWTRARTPWALALGMHPTPEPPTPNSTSAQAHDEDEEDDQEIRRIILAEQDIEPEMNPWEEHDRRGGADNAQPKQDHTNKERNRQKRLLKTKQYDEEMDTEIPKGHEVKRLKTRDETAHGGNPPTEISPTISMTPPDKKGSKKIITHYFTLKPQPDPQTKLEFFGIRILEKKETTTKTTDHVKEKKTS